jgi:hypothetical protein
VLCDVGPQTFEQRDYAVARLALGLERSFVLIPGAIDPDCACRKIDRGARKGLQLASAQSREERRGPCRTGATYPGSGTWGDLMLRPPV